VLHSVDRTGAEPRTSLQRAEGPLAPPASTEAGPRNLACLSADRGRWSYPLEVRSLRKRIAPLAFGDSESCYRKAEP
jgi:hypothetical protein